MTTSRRGLGALHHAFDEAQFGPDRTLNLRASLPTVRDAVARTEAWLRQRQVSGPHDVLIITGRGNHSDNGVSPVREAVLRHLGALRHRGVVSAHHEHTAGSFVVTLAPMRSVIDGPRRNRDHQSAPAPASPASLDSLQPRTLKLLRDLAELSLEDVGVKNTGPFLFTEMLRQFSALSRTIPDGLDRENRLHSAIRAALEARG
jgi:hypothetical protein